MPKVSVIIPSYNHEKFISEAIQSVLNQTFQDFEIIITDDASKDNSVKVIQQFSDPRIKFFGFSSNQGACVSIKNCIEHSSGEYIALLNSDDVFSLNKLERQVQFLDSNPTISAVFSYAEVINEEGDILQDENHYYKKIFIQNNRDRFGWLRYFFFRGNCICHPSMLIRKDCYKTIGLYDEKLAQLPDFDFWIRLCMKYEIHVLPEKLIKFRILNHELNVSGNNPNSNTRTNFEFPIVLKHYLSQAVMDDFTNIFPCKSSIEPDLIPFHVAMMALWHAKAEWDHSVYKVFAVNTLYEFLHHNPELLEILEKKYSFTYASFIKLTGISSRSSFTEELKTWYCNTPIDFDQIFQFAPQSAPSFFSTIKPISVLSRKRPFWSIMIPVYNPRLDYLEEVVESVLGQFQKFEDVQIEMIDDCSSSVDVQQFIGDRGWHQITYYRQPHNLGFIHTWNTCIERAYGEWVHILHQDDKVLPGFYANFHQALALPENQTVGAAFCQHWFIDKESQPLSASGLERSTPGILEDWIERLAVSQRIQFASVVVKRQVYETLGGFNLAAESAADWEMWKRISSYFPVWYEPQVLACYRLHDLSASSRLIATGRNIADTLQSILISKEYLPPDQAEYLSRLARDHYAFYALDTAYQMLNSNAFEAALAQIREGLRCSQSPSVLQQLVRIIFAIQTVVTDQKDWSTLVSQAINAFAQDPNNLVARTNLEKIRHDFCQYLLNSNPNELAGLLQSPIGKAYDMLLDAGAINLSI